MSVFRVAILGSGIGREHLAAYLQLSDRYQVSVLCDTDTQRAEELVADNGGIRIASDWQTVVNDSSIDIVDVCLPPDLHFDVCMAALAAGKHVVCEKPLVSSLREADQLREQCTLSGKTLTPVFQYRYGPALAQLRALLKANLCGTPLVANIETHWHRDAEYYDNPWRGTWLGERGGAVLGHAIHNHDLLCAIFGDVTRVGAFTATRVNDIETEDCAALSFVMANGALASSSITLGAASDTTRLKFCFSKLTATSGKNPYAPGDDVWTFQARGEASQQLVDECVASVGATPVGYAGLFTELAQRLNGREHNAVLLHDGRRSLELVSAIYHANATATVVDLPLDASHPRYDSWITA